jgi:hypothetical protein
MVQVTFDTNNDSLEELQEAFALLHGAIERRSPVRPGVAKMDIALATGAAEQNPPAEEETALDTPFLKITVKSDEHKNKMQEQQIASATPAMPTLNQLLHDESLTEEELAKMFGEHGAKTDTSRTHADAQANETRTEDVRSEYVKTDDTRTDDVKTEESPYIEIVEYADEK